MASRARGSHKCRLGVHIQPVGQPWSRLKKKHWVSNLVISFIVYSATFSKKFKHCLPFSRN